MPDFVTVKVEGLSELEEMLEKRVPKEAKTALRRAIRAGLKIFQKAISSLAPRRTGKLSEEIRISSLTTGGDDDASTGGIVGIVGPAEDVFYALFQEHGTVRQPAKPFIRPAFEASTDEVIKVFENELRAQLDGLSA